MIIGITGGIGSGKSYVVSLFEELGAIAYRADIRAKELVYLPEIKSQIIQNFGKESFFDDKYNTKFIASIVFNDKTKLELLNSIIHPAVFIDLADFQTKHIAKAIVYESALMIETGHTHLFDIVVLVTAPIDIRIERVMSRDHITQSQVEERITNQLSDEEKIQYADYIIENIDKEKTKKAVHLLWEELNAEK